MISERQKIGIIGLGKIGQAIARGLLATGVPQENLSGAERSQETASVVGDELGISVVTGNRDLIADGSVLIFAVKPHQVEAAVAEVADLLTPDHLVISVAAAVSTAQIEAQLSSRVPVVRAMPNTPCLVGEGMTALSAGKDATDEHLGVARAIFDAVGKTALVDEALMNGVTGLSGSGPAYVYVIIESLAEAGVKLGISRETSTLLAAQTVLGAAKMVVDIGEHPALLKDGVTTPAGCTIDGLLELEEGKLRVTLIKAVVTAAKRAAELA